MPATSRFALRLVLPIAIAIVLAPVPLSSQTSGGARNTMKVTISSGPDRGVHTVELGSKNTNGESTCSVLPRADRQPGSYFNGHFYPEMNGKPGLMEAVTAFNAGPNGRTDEASFAVTFVIGTGANTTMRAYEAESRPTRPRKGRAAATFSRTGSGATARVEGETAEGVKVVMEIACNAVSDR
jgi:hypothetical protein